MSLNPSEDLELLARYAAGECASAEAEDIEARLAAEPELRDAVRALRYVITERRSELRDGSVDAAAALASVRARVAARGPTGVVAELPVRRAPERAMAAGSRRRWPWVAQVAAVVLLLAGAGAAARTAFDAEPPAAPAPMRLATTGPAQRATFQLPDGSRVMLGVASTLRYAVGQSGPREIVLEGEAYFDVIHDERRPFVVRAGDLVATDLGTQFVVRAYPEDRHAHVVVREGKVDVAGRVIEPGQLGRMSSAGTPVVEQADTALHFAWTAGTLVLDRMPLRRALPHLGRWFNLEFHLADSALAARLITTTLVEQPTDDAMASRALALGIRYTRQGRVVTFSPAGY